VEKEAAVRRLKAAGTSVAEISRTLQLSRPTVYKALAS
jgi:DNA-binding CsgD family transcriptional regulator